MNTDDIVYVMVKLDENQKNDLIQSFNSRFPNSYEKDYCDHLTLAYGRDQVERFDFDNLLGKKVTLHGHLICYDEHCATLVVDRDSVSGLGCNNEHPHITLATDGITKPVYSNSLIEEFMSDDRDNHVNSLVADVTVTGTIDVFRRKTPAQKLVKNLTDLTNDASKRFL